MIVQPSVPPSASTVAVAQPIGFAKESPGAVPSVSYALLLTLVLIAMATAVLWAFRGRLGAKMPGVAGAGLPGRWQVSQRLRLGQGCVASFVQRDGAEWMIVESRAGIAVTRVDGEGAGASSP